jgi:hypothetical protein
MRQVTSKKQFASMRTVTDGNSSVVDLEQLFPDPDPAFRSLPDPPKNYWTATSQCSVGVYMYGINGKKTFDLQNKLRQL